MKIGILTFHDGINFGAFAQVYSMQCLLESFGHDVVVINYKNFRHWFNEYKAFYRTKRPSILLNNFKKIRKFRNLQKDRLKTNSFSFLLNRKLLAGLDIVIVGADEVWNFETELIGKDSAYFIPLDGTIPWISYAPSFGSVSKDTVLPREFCDGLGNFKALSVRDTNSKDLLIQNTGLEPVIVLDPTFMYPIHEQAIPTGRKDYYLYYSADIDRSYQQVILDFAHAHGKKLIAIGYKAAWADENIIDLDPFEWMGWIRDADIVFTTMFHGTIFSILQKKQFVTMSTEYRKNKMDPMMSELGLEDRIIDLDSTFKQELYVILGKEIDYAVIESKISLRRLQSLDYLDKALGCRGGEKA